MSVASPVLLTSSVQRGLTGKVQQFPNKPYLPSFLNPSQDVAESAASTATESVPDLSNTQFMAQIIAQFLNQDQSPSLALPYEKLVEYSEIKFKPSNAGRPLGIGLGETFAPQETPDISNDNTAEASQPSAGFISGIASYNATLSRNSTLPVVNTPAERISLPIFA